MHRGASVCSCWVSLFYFPLDIFLFCFSIVCACVHVLEWVRVHVCRRPVGGACGSLKLMLPIILNALPSTLFIEVGSLILTWSLASYWPTCGALMSWPHEEKSQAGLPHSAWQLSVFWDLNSNPYSWKAGTLTAEPSSHPTLVLRQAPSLDLKLTAKLGWLVSQWAVGIHLSLASVINILSGSWLLYGCWGIWIQVLFLSKGS